MSVFTGGVLCTHLATEAALVNIFARSLRVVDLKSISALTEVGSLTVDTVHQYTGAVVLATCALVNILAARTVRVEFKSWTTSQKVTTGVRSLRVATFLVRSTDVRSLDTFVYIDAISAFICLMSTCAHNRITTSASLIKSVTTRALSWQTPERTGNVVAFTSHATVVYSQRTLVVVETHLRLLVEGISGSAADGTTTRVRPDRVLARLSFDARVPTHCALVDIFAAPSSPVVHESGSTVQSTR